MTGHLQFSSIAESTNKLDFASHLMSREDVTYLAYNKKFFLRPES